MRRSCPATSSSSPLNNVLHGSAAPESDKAYFAMIFLDGQEDITMVFEKVRDMIASQLQVDASTITPESRLVEDLKADSANVMVMILELESEFGIEVEDEVILTLKTVGDVVDYIEKHQ